MQKDVVVKIGAVELGGVLRVPERPKGIVLFAHGAGSSRFSPRNNFVAEVLYSKGIASLLMDLLTSEEDEVYENRFNIPLLSERLAKAVEWLERQKEATGLRVGLFGSSTGAASALQVAARRGEKGIASVVSRGGRPDLAGEQDLSAVKSPTLLLVGGEDFEVIELNQAAFSLLKCEKKLSIIPGATHLFEEPGALEDVAEQAGEWFQGFF